jgi:hypothetical protein
VRRLPGFDTRLILGIDASDLVKLTPPARNLLLVGALPTLSARRMLGACTALAAAA